MDKRVNMRLVVMTQERPDRWAARLPAFGFTMYGKTEDEAKARTHDAVTALLQSFANQDEVEAFLKSRGVDYSIAGPAVHGWHEEPRFSMEVALAS